MRGYATFFRLWLGQSVSGLGSQLTGFGLAVWVYQETQSVKAMAMIAMAAAIPSILLSPLIGAFVDRLPRKTMLLFADCFAGIFSLMLVAVLTLGKLQLWQVYLVAGAGAVSNMIMWPTLSATTSLLVPKEQLARASGLLQFGDAGSQILSPVLGGVVYGFLGLRGLVTVDAATFVFAVAMTLLCRIPQPKATAEGKKAKGSLWKEAWSGFEFIFARAGLVAAMIYFMFINLVLPLSMSLIAPIILSHWKAQTLGMVQSIAGSGMLLGTVIMTAWGGPKRLVNGFWVFGIATFIASLMLALPLSIVMMCAAFFLMMVSSPIVNGCSQAIWQKKTPADVQGKVFTARRMIAWFMTPLAFALVGPLADGVFEPNHHPAAWLKSASFGLLGTEPGSGYQAMFVLSGALTLLATIAVFLSPRFRRIETEIPDATLAAEPEKGSAELVTA